MALIAALPLVLPLVLGAQQPAPPLSEAEVAVVTLDDVRQGQVKHGRALLEDILGHEHVGRLGWLEPGSPADAFRSCEDESPDRDLERCARFFLRRSGGRTATVAVVFSDWSGPSPNGRAGAMRVNCYGRGSAAADRAAQDTWLWPTSARLRGINAWIRDRDALAACIAAALAEGPD